MDLEEYMTVAEAAKKLKKSIPLIGHLCRNGKLSGVIKMTTGAWLIPRASVESYQPGKRGPRTKREKLTEELDGIRAEIENSEEE
jgi:diadenosine tetraphosphate (Ap4A) HIT family hydrolase